MSPGEEIDRLANENRKLTAENHRLYTLLNERGTAQGGLAMSAEAKIPQPMKAREMSTGEKLRLMGQDAHKSADDFNTLAELYESLEPGGRRERALKRLLVDAFRLIGPPL